MAEKPASENRIKEFRNKLVYWRNRLLDLGGRNRFIFFKELKTGSVRIVEPGSGFLLQRLVNRNQACRLVFEDPGGLAENEVLVSGIDDDLGRSLFYIRLRTRTAREEKGVNVLFLAVGFLNWYESESSDEVIRSPLFLLPVQIQRTTAEKSHQLDYVISPLEEELELNLSLSIKLENAFGIAINELSLPSLEDLNDTSISTLLEEVRTRIQGKPHWEVTDKAYLGIFSYQKLAMYEDLGELEENLLDHPVIRAMAAISSYQPDYDSIGLRDLDEREKSKELFQILDADSSQQQAIAIAKQGVSLVLQGPPGTGKSQTIANLIGEFLARRKSVLFVSAKMAALDVVKKRLDDVGIGRFCLELHSDRPDKKTIYRDLAFTWVGDVKVPSEEELEELERLDALKAQLNSYFQELHRKRTKLRITPYRVYGELALVANAPQIKCKIPNPMTINRKKWEDGQDAIRQLASVVSDN